MNIYRQRRKFIDKVGKHLIELLNNGSAVWYQGELVKSVIQRGLTSEVFGLTFELSPNTFCVFYHHGKDYDNGYFTSIEELKQQLLKDVEFVRFTNFRKIDFQEINA